MSEGGELRVDPSAAPAGRSQGLQELRLPAGHNYIATFLTLACNLRCGYCINLHEAPLAGRRRILQRPLDAASWIAAIDRLPSTAERPITLQGGEPTVHPGFYEIVCGVRPTTHFDLLTNLRFDPDEFARRVPLPRFLREAPYAPIRVSYHPGQNDIEELLAKTLRLESHGFRVGIYGVLHPDQRDEILACRERALTLGIDFRTKEFLGTHEERVHGTYRYEGAIEGERARFCTCRTSEVLVAPSGDVFRCHSDLYEGRTAVGHILDPRFTITDQPRPCFVYGHCNPCDVKVKTDRYQVFGHTSVTIDGVRELTPSERRRLSDGDCGLGLPARNTERAAADAGGAGPLAAWRRSRRR